MSIENIVLISVIVISLLIVAKLVFFLVVLPRLKQRGSGSGREDKAE
ncbi:MAG: hypothetical protein R3E95_19205 [Thiolinea sp.]